MRPLVYHAHLHATRPGCQEEASGLHLLRTFPGKLPLPVDPYVYSRSPPAPEHARDGLQLGEIGGYGRAGVGLPTNARPVTHDAEVVPLSWIAGLAPGHSMRIECRGNRSFYGLLCAGRVAGASESGSRNRRRHTS